MKLILNIKTVKIVYTPQGTYLKTNVGYKYMVVLLPEDTKLKKIDQYIYLDVDDIYYKHKRMYRFDTDHIEQFRIKE